MKFTVFLFMVLPTVLTAQNSGGLRFLTIGADAASLGYAETTVAKKTGSTSLFNNPAMMVFEDNSSTTISHTLWLLDTGITSASVLLKNPRSASAFGVISSNTNGIEARKKAGPPDGEFAVSYYAFTAGYSRLISSVSLGISASYLYEQLFEQYSTGYSMSFGAATGFLDSRIQVASAVLNIGEMRSIGLTASEIPGLWKSGMHLDLLQFSAAGAKEIPVLISLATDVNVPTNQPDVYYSLAVEATISKVFDIRAGFRTDNTTRPFSLGVGLSQKLVTFQYAFIPFETGYNNTHSLSLSYTF